MIEFVWPRFGRELHGLFEFTVDLATDELTGFSVRKLYYLELNELIAPIAPQVLAGTAKKKVVVVVFDMAMLNLVNEEGHDAGNGYIVRVAAALKFAAEELLRLGAEDVFIGRLGGDEFGLLAVGLLRPDVESVVRRAQEEVAKTDLEHIDAGFADLSDPIKLQQLRGKEGEILVSLEPGRGAARAAVRRVDLIADERANIAKAITRIYLLARLFAFAPDAYEKVAKFGRKAVSSVEETEIKELAEKLKREEDILLDVRALALRVRSEVMSKDLFKQAISLVAELDFKE